MNVPGPDISSSMGTDPVCAGANTGAISVAGTGGTLPYTYSLDNATFQSGDFTGLMAGPYMLYGQDSRGCPDGPIAITLTDPPVKMHRLFTPILPFVRLGQVKLLRFRELLEECLHLVPRWI